MKADLKQTLEHKALTDRQKYFQIYLGMLNSHFEMKVRLQTGRPELLMNNLSVLVPPFSFLCNLKVLCMLTLHTISAGLEPKNNPKLFLCVMKL